MCINEWLQIDFLFFNLYIINKLKLKLKQMSIFFILVLLNFSGLYISKLTIRIKCTDIIKNSNFNSSNLD